MNLKDLYSHFVACRVELDGRQIDTHSAFSDVRGGQHHWRLDGNDNLHEILDFLRSAEDTAELLDLS